MFLRKELKQDIKGTILVPFCKDCDSQDIEIIRTCKQCGSHNITEDWTDKRSQRVEVKEHEVSIYKCDICGKEFDGLNNDCYMSYAEGDFEKSNYSNFYDSENVDYINYQLSKDLCPECKSKSHTRLTLKLVDFLRPENINKIIEEWYKEKSK